MPAAPTANKTRALQAGDNWTYDVSGQVDQSTFTGTTNVSISQETIDGVPFLEATYIIDFTFNGSNFSSRSVQYYRQDTSTHDIAQYGRKLGSEPIATVTNKPLPVVWPGSWEPGKTITADIQFSDGTATSSSYKVTGQESVTTSAGTFSTWKCVSNLVATSHTVWFSPDLGYFVKMESSSISYSLRSTNITGL